MITAVKKPKKRVRAREKTISLETFEKNYLEKTAYKYEWKNGRIIKEEYMKANERYIINNIIRQHIQTENFQQGNSIMAEADCYFSALGAYRRPDAAYFTPDQINFPETAKEAPAFVIEVSSPSNSGEHNIEKMLEYFSAGASVVWYIYPNVKQVWIYTDPKEVTICHPGDTCQAAPAIPEFNISVDEIFSKPQVLSP